MKKILALVLAVFMLASVVTLTSCGKKKIEPKDAFTAIAEATKKSTELNSVKGDVTVKASVDANVEGQAIKGKADLSGNFTLAGLKGGSAEAEVSLKLKIDGVDEFKTYIGDDPVEAKVVLKDEVAYVDLKSSGMFGNIKFKIDVPVDDALDMADSIGSIDTDEIDTSDIEEYIKSSTVSESGGKKTYTLTFDSSKIKDAIAESGVSVKSMDDATVTVIVSKNGYIQGVKFQIKNLDVDAGSEGAVKGDVEFTLNIDNPGKDYTVNAPVNAGDYNDFEDVLGGLFGY